MIGAERMIGISVSVFSRSLLSLLGFVLFKCSCTLPSDQLTYSGRVDARMYTVNDSISGNPEN